jgi:hypothetical protein
MKKHLLTLAIASLSTVPVIADVDTTLYGSLRLYASGGDSRDLDISNDASRIGVKGSATTSIDGVKAIYRLEGYIGNDNGTDSSSSQNEASFGLDGRLAYVGLEGNFGQVVVGQQWSTLYNLVTGVVDMTYNNDGETIVYWRVDSAATWVSPEMNGLQLAVSTFADADDSSSDQADHYQAAAKYNLGAVTLAAGFDRAANPAIADVQSVSINWSADALTLAALVQREKADTAGAEAVNPYELAGSYQFGQQTLILTAYNADADVDTYGFNLELHSALGDNTTLYTNLESDYVDSENDLAAGVGLKVDF